MDHKSVFAPPTASLTQPDIVTTELASRWSRYAAGLIDLLLIIFPLIGSLWLNLHVSIEQDYGIEGAWLLSILLSCVWFAILHGYWLFRGGQTLGKLLTGIKIVSHQNHRPIAFSTVFFGRYVPIIIALHIPILGWLILAIDGLVSLGPKRRCIHDWIAGSEVINAD